MPVRRLCAVALAVVFCAALGAWAAGAQVAPGTQQVPPVDSTTTTTAPPPGSSTTVPRSTTTTAPPGGAGGGGAPPPAPAPGGGDSGGGDGGGDGGGGEAGPRVVPPEAQARIDAYPRSKANSTRRLLAALQPLVDLGLTPTEAAVAGFGRFPVAGEATFVNDWLFPRFSPEFRFHEGTDIFAAAGTPVRSPTEGTLTRVTGRLGGQAVYIHQADGTYFYMAHLSAWNDEHPDGSTVEVGDVVGYVGDSGDAKGGAPHTHLEIHPAPVREVVTGRGKNRQVSYQVQPVPKGTALPPIDPKPYLDQWLDEALARAPEVIAAYSRARPRPSLEAVLAPSPQSARAAVFAGPAGPTQSQLLWASAANPAGGVLAVADAEAARVASTIDWDARARRAAARRQEWAQADARARAILAPLTPRALQPYL